MSDTETRRVFCRTCHDMFPENRTRGGECRECAQLSQDCRAIVRQLSRIVDMLAQIADRLEEGGR